MYYLLVNGKPASKAISSWPARSSIRVCIKGLLGGTKPKEEGTKIHLKINGEPQIYVFEVRKNAVMEDVTTLVDDVFGPGTCKGLFQDHALLDIGDSVSDWLTSTLGKSEISLKADIEFAGNESVVHIPVMETIYDGVSRWVRNTPDWRKVVEDRHQLGDEQWRLDNESQEWEEGPVRVIVDDSSEEEESAEVESKVASSVGETPDSETHPPISLKVESDDQERVQMSIDVSPEPAEAREAEGNPVQDEGPSPPTAPSVEAPPVENSPPVAPRKRSHIFVDWNGERKELQFDLEWEIWKGLRELTGRNRFFSVQFESPNDI
jgi:hypothetical protein